MLVKVRSIWRRGEDLNPRGTCAPIRFRVGRLQPGSATPPRNVVSILHDGPASNLSVGPDRLSDRAQVYPSHHEPGGESVAIGGDLRPARLHIGVQRRRVLGICRHLYADEPYGFESYGEEARMSSTMP